MAVDCSILVLSCDKNVGVLNIFFDLFHKNWADCPYKIYLGMEKRRLEYENVETLLSNKKMWAERVKDYLQRIKEKYIFLLLDDFIVEKTVDTITIEKYINYLINDPMIVTISLADIYDKRNYESEYEGLVRRVKNANYLLNMQAGIWNKTILLQLMKDKESPWQTELFGSIRARKLDKYKFLCLKSDEESPYRYGRGWLLVRGCWNGNEIKRLNLEMYAKEFLDGKDILFSEISQIKLGPRIKRRLQITYRKVLSFFGIYI